MNDPSIENLNLLDTEYADILANSIHPSFELRLIQLGLDPQEARSKTRLITLMSRKPQTKEDWENLKAAWQDACGYQPSDDAFTSLSQMLWHGNQED